jgi:hypothetical protein
MPKIVRCSKVKDADHDAFIRAMWLLYCRTPKKAAPEADGSFFLGEVGEAPEKSWVRLTPYSLAVPK